MKKSVMSICIGFLLAVSLVCSAGKTSHAISEGVIRLHIRANSNTPEDQELKLKVRDRILKEAEKMAQDTHSTEEAEEVIVKNLAFLEDTAQDEIQKNGYNYSIDADFGKSKFPLKTYGDLTLPAGTYKALTIDIGEGKGENWWCVMFPPLCFTKEAFAKTDPVSDEILAENLGSDNYDMLKNENIQIKFKIYEIISNIFDNF